MVRKRTRSTAPTGELAKVMAETRSTYGAHVMSPADEKPAFKHTPTGVFTLDMALFGGVPEGLVSLIFGYESSGKTTLAQRIVGQSQRKYPGSTAVFVDIEGTYDPVWGAVHGVDNARMLLVQPETGEQALDIVDAVMHASDTSVIVVDSLAALLPFREQDKSIEDELPGIQARLISKFCRKVQSALGNERKRGHYPAIILLNQWRRKIGVIYGDNRVLPGGMSQRFIAAAMIEVLCKETFGHDDRDMEVADFNTHSFKLKKCKFGNGLKHGEFKMIRNPSHPLGQGFIDDARTVATYAKKMGVITGGGASWRVDGLDERFSNLQGICDYFYSDLDFFTALQQRLITEQRRACGLVAEGWM